MVHWQGCWWIISQRRSIPETCRQGARWQCAIVWEWEIKTYNKILFIGQHNIHCIDIISAVWLVYNEFVFLEWNEVTKEVWARIQRESQKKYNKWLTFSRKCWPHRWSFQDNSPVLSSRMRYFRWKLRSLLRLGNRRWMVSWSIRLDCERALEYFYVYIHVGDKIKKAVKRKAPTCIISRSWTY
jgi:hypothetical protein